VLTWLWSELRAGTPRALMMPWRVAVFAALGTVMGAVGVWNAARWGTASDYSSLQILVGRAAIGALLGLAMGLLAYALMYRLAVTALTGKQSVVR